MSETCENCTEEKLEAAPPLPSVYAKHPGKIAVHLRDAAARRDGFDILRHALGMDPKAATTPRQKARELAEVAVTGYDAFAALRKRWGQRPVWTWSMQEAKDVVTGAGLPTTPAGSSPAELRASQLVDRARSVAMFLLANDPELRLAKKLPPQVKAQLAGGRSAMRARLGAGWIATVGEVDPPHRSVNVHATKFVERRSGPITLMIGKKAERKFQTDIRYVLEGPEDAPVMVLLHGHSSKIEELEDVIPKLSDRFRVLVFDQPGGAGYTRGDIPAAPTKAESRPALSDLTDVVVGFIAHLRSTGELRKGAKIGFAGGSLGGHLAMRLSARPGAIRGAKAFAAWSPGSAWHLPKDSEAGPENSFMFFGWGRPEERMSRKLEDEARFGWDDYLKLATTRLSVWGLPVLLDQAQHWYWDRWYPEVRAAMIEECYEARREIFHKDFRVMHWQLAWEQMVFSHHGLPGKQDAQPFRAYKAPLLLMAGCNDNLFPERLATGTHDLYMRMRSEKMKNVQWRGFCCTGHSIHNERPQELADVLAAWLESGTVA